MFNAAAYFVDRHIEEGRGGSTAIECGDRRLSYRDLFDQVNRAGNALRVALDVRPEERVLLVMCDGPEMIAAFFGAIKIGAIPVPLNTRWTTADYEFVLRDSSARVIIVGAELLDAAAPAIAARPSLRHVVVVGQDVAGRLPGAVSFETLVAASSPALEPEPTSADAPAFWLYSSGSTGQPKGCVHLQHDMKVCADAYAPSHAVLLRADSLRDAAGAHRA
jgi:acyl-coenzyme A synthetase/AMP-(fatty) acid ligase